MALIVVGTACGSSGYSASAPTQAPTGIATAAARADSSASASNRQVIEKDFAISLDSASAPAGKITFNVKNDGPSTHEFVVFKTDDAPSALPVDQNKVIEDASGVTHVDEIGELAAGGSNQLTLTLDPGKYVLICNLPAHYGLGMHAAFEVR